MMVIALATILDRDSFVHYLCALLLLCQLLTPAAAKAAATASGYSIVLASAPGKNLKWEPRESHLFEDRTIYVEKTSINRLL